MLIQRRAYWVLMFFGSPCQNHNKENRSQGLLLKPNNLKLQPIGDYPWCSGFLVRKYQTGKKLASPKISTQNP